MSEKKKAKGKWVSFVVDDEIAKRIKAEADADGLTSSSWVRSLIIRSLRERDREAAREKKPAEGSS